MPSKVLFLVATECPEELDAKFNKWYTNVHVPMVLKAPGVIAATRYEALNPQPGQPKYLAVYELEDETTPDRMQESPEMAAARADRQAVWGQGGFTAVRKEYYKRIEK